MGLTGVQPAVSITQEKPRGFPDTAEPTGTTPETTRGPWGGHHPDNQGEDRDLPL